MLVSMTRSNLCAQNGHWMDSVSSISSSHVCQRWVETCLAQQPTKVHQRRPIQLQTFHRGPPGGSEPLDNGGGFSPLEVLMPGLRAGVEEWNHAMSYWIRRGNFCSLPIVAALTRQHVIGSHV